MAQVLVFALAGLLLAGCLEPRPPELPVPLASVVPDSWQFATDVEGELLDTIAVNIDGDPESEYMILFRYDNSEGAQGPVGGVIYDAQQNASTYQPDVTVPLPYQPSVFLVPYRLLPDWSAGKGQGYLADTWASWDFARSSEELTQADELNISGYGPGGFTRLSIFWWTGPTEGYAIAYFEGSGGITVLDRGSGGAVQQVLTRSRMNERSFLCSVVEYTRGNDRTFVGTPPTIEFCRGTPVEPTYPEAVVLAWLLAPMANLLVDPGQFDAIYQVAPEPQRVISVTYPGGPEQIGEGKDAEFWYTVDTTVETNNVQQSYRWRLKEIKPQEVRETAVWRIDSVEQR